MKLWVDDLREPPDGSWLIARSSRAAIEALRSGWFDQLSLDHDLGGDDTGYVVALWLEEHPHLAPAMMRCHSANPVGHDRIQAAFDSILRRKPDLTSSSQTATIGSQ